MAIRGRKPKPTKVIELEGNRTKRKSRVNRKEPEPARVIPACPDWLNDDAKAEWETIVPVLYDCGLLTLADKQALIGYCQSYARFKQAEAVIESEGMTFTTPNGYVQQRPEVSISQKERSLMDRFAEQLGLSPSARARLEIKPQPKKSGMAGLING